MFFYAVVFACLYNCDRRRDVKLTYPKCYAGVILHKKSVQPDTD
ncbi:hypothetical protein ENTCAN_08266 [Enterobacter cancerogenus ATCC 35316]|nr:hypothetical protein ENTCAN_08266 [Enterobacter cancerogenus ATCC 35316]